MHREAPEQRKGGAFLELAPPLAPLRYFGPGVRRAVERVEAHGVAVGAIRRDRIARHPIERSLGALSLQPREGRLNLWFERLLRCGVNRVAFASTCGGQVGESRVAAPHA